MMVAAVNLYKDFYTVGDDILVSGDYFSLLHEDN